ncbi:MAG: nucleoside deaminase [Phycisphaerales bacterium]|nr:nucleoside deaminase [Phycisphaerales bacterium]
MLQSDEQIMLLAIAQAQEALKLNEVPIGCVIFHNPTQRIIGTGYNRRQIDHDPTAHAEMIAIRAAGAALGDWRLLDCTLYVTLEPCPMCAGAIVNARLPRIVYGAADPKAGACQSLFSIVSDRRLNHQVECTPGVLAESCAQLLRQFFATQRAMGKK